MNKTCKDCIHYEVCDKKYRIATHNYVEMDSRPTYDRKCNYDFKDKSRYIELPCAVGDKVYVIFSTFYAEYKIIKFLYDGAFVWAKLINEEYEPQNREILRCISFDINKTIFLDENEASRKVKQER